MTGIYSVACFLTDLSTVFVGIIFEHLESEAAETAPPNQGRKILFFSFHQKSVKVLIIMVISK